MSIPVSICKVLLLFLLAPVFAFAEEGEYCLVLDIETAVRIALEANWGLQSSREGLIKSGMNLNVSYADFGWRFVPKGNIAVIGGGTAGTGPSIGGGFDAERKFQYGTRVCIGPTLLKAAEKFHADLNFRLTQPLLRGFGRTATLSGLRSAEFAYRSASRSFFTSQVNLITRTVKALYDVVKQEESVRLHQESVERVRGFYNTARIKEKIGLAETLDIYRAEYELRQTEEAWYRACDQYHDALDSLKEILALPMATSIQVDIPLEYHCNDWDVEEAIQTAIEHRIEIQQAEDQFQEGCRLSKIAKNNLLPQIDLVLNYTNSNLGQVFSKTAEPKRESQWGVGLQTSQDFNPAAQQSAFQQSLLAIDAAERSIAETRQKVVREVKRSLRQLKQAHEKIQTQEEQILSSEGERKLTQLKFERGMGNHLHVIQAEKKVRQAKISYIHAVVEHITEEVQILANMGVLVPTPEDFCESLVHKECALREEYDWDDRVEHVFEGRDPDECFFPYTMRYGIE